MFSCSHSFRAFHKRAFLQPALAWCRCCHEGRGEDSALSLLLHSRMSTAAQCGMSCRDTAQAVAKQEIAELRRANKRDGLDLTYLKNVILGGFESGELSTRSSMLPVLARLLEFSPAEVSKAMKPKPRV